MRVRAWSAAVVVSWVAVLAGCGGDDGGEGATVTQPSSGPCVLEPFIGAPEGVVSYCDVIQGHVAGNVQYRQTPPVGGIHNDPWQECGYYDEPIGNERGVHSLEHGAVWVTYQPSLPADQVAILRQLANGRTHMLVSPYEGIPAPVVASAWGQQLLVQAATDPRLVEFIDFFEEGPQTPELGASC